MGSTKLRKLIKSETKWTDKNTIRHRHNFCIHTIAEVINGSAGFKSYYNVMKCEYCNSFKCISQPNNVMGLIQPGYIDTTLPVIRLYSPHTWIIGWKDVVLRGGN